MEEKMSNKLIPKHQNAWQPLIYQQPINPEVIKKSQEMLQYLSQHSDEQKAKKESEEKDKQEKKEKRQQNFINAMLTIAMGENAPVAIASGYGYDENGNIGQYYVDDPGVVALRNNLAIVSTFSPTHPASAITEYMIFPTINKMWNNPTAKTIRKNILGKLKNTYYNKAPWTFKPNRNYYYRVGDKSLIDDVKKSGVIKTDGVVFPEHETYFSKGVPLDGNYNSAGGIYGNFMIEVSDQTPFIGKSMGTITQQGLKRDLSNINYNFNSTHNLTEYVVPKQSFTQQQPLVFNKEQMSLYKPNWFFGYKKIQFKTGGKLIPKYKKHE